MRLIWHGYRREYLGTKRILFLIFFVLRRSGACGCIVYGISIAFYLVELSLDGFQEDITRLTHKKKHATKLALYYHIPCIEFTSVLYE